MPPDHQPGNSHDHSHVHGGVDARRGHDDQRGKRPLRIGIGGPVGSGKTALVAALCRLLSQRLSIVVVTNDIFTTEDAEALRRMAVLPDDRIAPVETGRYSSSMLRGATRFLVREVRA